MDSTPFLSVIIPAFNEQDRLVPTLENTIQYLEKQQYSSEIIVVSDGSTDHTAQVPFQFSPPQHVRIQARQYFPNQGKGYAVRYGMLGAKGRVVMFMDADYAVPMTYCEQGLNLIKSGFDIAIASRAVTGAVIEAHQNFFRMLSAKLYTGIQNTYLGIHYLDTQCGFKFFTHGAARKLFSQQKLNSVIFDPEILWLAKKAGYRIGEFPVQWRHVADSRIQYDSLRKSLFVFQELFRIKRLHAR